jgi:hypothetical protein
MKDLYKDNLIKTTLCIGLLIVFYLLPFSLYGADGYVLWYPIIAEYLRGSSSFRYSHVVFDGQNLAAIYGEFPFWKILRLFGPSIEFFLNATHWVFTSMFFILSISIVSGIKKKVSKFDILAIFIYSLLSPILVNRVLAGHLNLLFGILPFFVYVSLIFNKSILNIVFCILSIWCAMSIQAFQLLAYHVFYLPFLLFIVCRFEKNKKIYILISLLVLLVAFGLNFPNFVEMYGHASNENNLRSLDTNIVYSLFTSRALDLFQFVLTGNYPGVLRRADLIFHETNYSIGAFLLFLIYFRKDRSFLFAFFATFFVLYLFCMKVAPFDLISELPLIKAFRVPQRVFMAILAFIPLWVCAHVDFDVRKADIIILLTLIVVAQLIPFSDVAALLAVAVFLFYKKYESIKWAFIVSLAFLTTGTLEKIFPSYEDHAKYESIRESLIPLTKKYEAQTLRTRVFHFETAQPYAVNYVAQTMGIKTIEGYGHPPARFIKKLKNKTGIRLSITTNTFYLHDKPSKNEKLLKEFGVQTIVSFDQDNTIQIKDI